MNRKYTKSVSESQLIRLQDLVARVAHKTGVQPRGNGKSFVLKCPAHEDGKPSFSVSEGSDGTILMYCFVGCSFQDICNSLSIDPQHLFAPNQQEKRKPAFIKINNKFPKKGA